MDGTLSREEFKTSGCYMVDLWATHCPHVPQWRWCDSTASSLSLLQGEGYLVLEDWPIEMLVEPEGTQVDIRADEGTDFATVCLDYHEPHYYTYHIIYNDIYRVPKLLLKGRYSDGRPIEWQDVLQTLPAGSNNDGTKWTFLTYEEHPYLHMPWLALHPCGTSELMKMVSDTSSWVRHEDVLQTSIANFYVLTWLSFVSQAVALKLPKHLSQCFKWISNRTSS